LVENFTSFAALFQEYRIRRAVFDFTPIGVNDGVTILAWKDDDFQNPSADSIASTTNFLKSNNSAAARSTFRTTWTARDIDNLDFESTSSPSGNAAALQIYTNTTTYGTQPTKALWLVRGMLRIEFRGLSAPV
jgi:hypothetical protein